MENIMGLPLPANAPTITVNDRTFGAGAFLWNTANGLDYIGGVFELKADGWNFVTSPNYVFDYVNPGEMVADMKAKGGSVAYIKWFIDQINAAFAKLFGTVVVPPVVTVEPSTDDEILAEVQAAFGKLKLTLVNGVPVLG
jgi:hypothetical protein